tara:strand:- start:322 stop:579 length:258 start_codon:yes stop_codon:yes gene_type:complete
MSSTLITNTQLEAAVGSATATAGLLKRAQDWGEEEWPKGLPADEDVVRALKNRYGARRKHESTLKLTSKLLKKIIKEEIEKALKE